MAVNAVLIAQEDLARACGSTMRTQFAAEALVRAGASVTTVGWATGKPLIESGDVVVAGGRGAIGKLRAIVAGLGLARRGATHVMLTSIGAPYNGFVAWWLCRRGVKVVYDAHDPVPDAIVLVFGSGALVRLGMPLVALSQRLLDRSTSVTFAAGGPRFEGRLRAHGWRGEILPVLNVHGLVDGRTPPDRTLRSRLGWNGAKIVIYAGGLQRWRGLTTQIDAVALARARGADVRMILNGFFDQMDYASYARARGLGEDAIAVFPALLPADALHGMLAACDFVVSSERVDYITQSKVCDALANGVRVVSIDDGRDINAFFGDLFAYYDGTPQDLARVLAECEGRMTDGECETAIERLKGLREQSRANVLRAFDL
jgi:glycosyltransferase involved in cell wall biosynthesis